MNIYTPTFIFLLLLVSCHSAIKHEDIVAKNLQIGTVITTFPIPDANENMTIENSKDLIGYWVGMFRPRYDSTDEEDAGENIQSQANKINISIDTIEGSKVIGHTVLAGRLRSITGTFLSNNSKYEFTLRQAGDDKNDGEFNFSINKGDSIISGTWDSFKKDSAIKREYKLKKTFFAYTPNQQLDGRFGDWRNKKTEKVVMENDADSYTEEKYLASTEDLFKYNASKKLITSTQAANLRKADIIILRNSIYARHGFAFKNKALNIFFDSQDWYIPIYDNVSPELTIIEKQNIAMLLTYEKNAKTFYDRFGR